MKLIKEYYKRALVGFISGLIVGGIISAFYPISILYFAGGFGFGWMGCEIIKDFVITRYCG